MRIIKSSLQDCLVIQPNVIDDKRGFFCESYHKKKLNDALGYEVSFVQENESFSSKGVLRGLHYQTGDFAQAKLVRVTHGKVLDVVVDLRKNSPTFSKHFTIELSAENKIRLFVPKGFAHGFVVLSETALFSYKCDNYYHKPSEAGIIYCDSELNIDWKLSKEDLIISDKDLILPSLSNAVL